MNVLDHSTTVENILTGKCPPYIPYKVKAVTHILPYYLADGIYPSWVIFVKTIRDGSTRKEKAFASEQEGMGKGIERALAVMVARFHILQRPSPLF